MQYTTDELIGLVAKEVAAIVPNCLGVTLGGSRAYGFEDQLSDVEMYFYSTTGAPSLDDLNLCMEKLRATHKRCPSFLWNEQPWGPHSFFVIDGLYFEIGYRKIDEIAEKISTYQSGAVEPRQDCHDLGLGYMTSGLAASVVSEKILLSFGDEIANLKEKAAEFSPTLLTSLKNEYLETARSLLYGKLHSAACREDLFFYDLLANRITRALLVMAFAVCKRHFPGDKWNLQLLSRSGWERAEEFLSVLKQHALTAAETQEEFLRRREYLVRAFAIIEQEVESCYGKTV